MTDQIEAALLWPRTSYFAVMVIAKSDAGPLGAIEKKLAVISLASQAAGAFAGHKLYGGALAIYAGGAVGTLVTPYVILALASIMK